jgi:hypothetical protein
MNLFPIAKPVMGAGSRAGPASDNAEVMPSELQRNGPVTGFRSCRRYVGVLSNSRLQQAGGRLLTSRKVHTCQ